MKYYHWTEKKHLKNIMKSGLIQKTLNCVTLTDEKNINYWKEKINGEVLLEVELTFNEIEKFFYPETLCLFDINTMWLFPGNISPKKIKILK